MNKKEVTGIILAGGKSKRMGTDKGLIPFRGRSLIRYAEEVLTNVCGQIIISSNSENYTFLNYPVVPDEIANSGPMGGIYSALKHSKTEINLVLSCDMPFISMALLTHLISLANEYDIVVPWHGEKHFEPMAAIYNKKNLPTLYQYIKEGNFRIPDVFEVTNTKKLKMSNELDYYSDQLFYNINSKSELKKVE